MIYTMDVNDLGLPGADREQRNPWRQERRNRDGPFAVGGQTSRASLSQTHRQRAIDLPSDHGIIWAGRFARVLEQDELTVRRNVSRRIPIMPSKIDAFVASGSRVFHGQSCGIQRNQDTTI